MSYSHRAIFKELGGEIKINNKDKEIETLTCQYICQAKWVHYAVQCGEWDQSIRQCNTVAGDPNDGLHRVTSRYNWITVHHAAARCPPLSPAVPRSRCAPVTTSPRLRAGSRTRPWEHPDTACHAQFAVSITHIDYLFILAWCLLLGRFFSPTLDIIDMVYILQWMILDSIV